MLKLVVAASLLVVVAGCSDPEPKEPRPSPSATPTVTAPTMPAQAKENTDEGAAAFVKYYIDVLNYASNTGQVEDLSGLSSPQCQGCNGYIKLYRDTYKAGGYFKDSDWSLGALDVRFEDSRAVVFGTVTSPAGTYAETGSAAPQPGNPTDSDLTFIVTRSAGKWSLDTMELQAAS